MIQAQPPTRFRAKVVAFVAAVVLLGVACDSAAAPTRMAFVVPAFAPALQSAGAAPPAVAAFPAEPWGNAWAAPVPRGQEPFMAAARIRAGDEVKVLSGDSKGETGKVLKIDSKKGLLVVEGVNIRSKHVKPMKEGEAGSIVKKEMPIHMSNVAVVDAPVDSAATAALAVHGHAIRSPDPVMRIGGRSWIPFMSEAASTDEDVVSEEAETAEAKPQGRGGRKKNDVSVWKDADPKDWITGTVRSVQPYGAFVTLSDGNDGLLHVSQMSDSFVDNPEQIVSVGDEVKVRVIKVDTDRNQVALSMKDPSARPPRQQNRGNDNKAKNAAALKELAETADEKVFVPGTVTNIMDFGAFVKLEDPPVEGLVHISQVKDGYLASVSDELTVGDAVQVRVESVDQAKGQLKLSMLEWKDPAEAGEDRRRPSNFDSDIAADVASAEELEALAIGYDEESPSWFDVALARAEEKKAKKAR